MERCLKLNKKKLRFKLCKVAYMGQDLGADDLQADPEKITAIRQMPHPIDVQGLQRLIGVVTYLSKLLPQLNTVCEPLRRLTGSQTGGERGPVEGLWTCNPEVSGSNPPPPPPSTRWICLRLPRIQLLHAV